MGAELGELCERLDLILHDAYLNQVHQPCSVLSQMLILCSHIVTAANTRLLPAEYCDSDDCLELQCTS